jgi:plasmid replication initiation protein
MKKNLTVYKANPVIEAGYRLSLNEQRVVLACIAQVNSVDKLLVTDKFELSAKDFAQVFSISEDAAYLALVDVAENLFNRYVTLDNPFPKDPSVTQLKTRWISSIRYKAKAGKVVLCFSQDMLPYLSGLKGSFTLYELRHIGNMTSIYSIRLYELLMQWKTTGKREIEIDWLKKQFEIEGLYPDMCDFKKRVIDPAVKDINTHSDYTVSWTQRKTGRNVTHLTFTFGKKPAANNTQKPASATQEPKIFGVPKSDVEKHALPGDSWQQAAERAKAKKGGVGGC